MATTPEGRTSERFGEHESTPEFPTVVPLPITHRPMSAPRRRMSCPSITPIHRRISRTPSRGYRTPRNRSPVRELTHRPNHQSRPSQPLDSWEGNITLVGTPMPLSMGRNLSESSIDTVEDLSLGTTSYRARAMSMPVEELVVDQKKLQNKVDDLRKKISRERTQRREVSELSRQTLDAYERQKVKLKRAELEKEEMESKYDKMERECSREKRDKELYLRKISKLKQKNEQQSSELMELRMKLAKMEAEKKAKEEMEATLKKKLEMEAEEREAQRRKMESQSMRMTKKQTRSSSDDSRTGCFFNMDWSRMVCMAGGNDTLP